MDWLYNLCVVAAPTTILARSTFRYSAILSKGICRIWGCSVDVRFDIWSCWLAITSLVGVVAKEREGREGTKGA